MLHYVRAFSGFWQDYREFMEFHFWFFSWVFSFLSFFIIFFSFVRLSPFSRHYSIDFCLDLSFALFYSSKIPTKTEWRANMSKWLVSKLSAYILLVFSVFLCPKEKMHACVLREKVTRKKSNLNRNQRKCIRNV